MLSAYNYALILARVCKILVIKSPNWERHMTAKILTSKINLILIRHSWNWTWIDFSIHFQFSKKEIRPVWLNAWVFVYHLNGCGFESRCSYLKLRNRACIEQGLPWNSGNYREQIHSKCVGDIKRQGKKGL